MILNNIDLDIEDYEFLKAWYKLKNGLSLDEEESDYLIYKILEAMMKNVKINTNINKIEEEIRIEEMTEKEQANELINEIMKSFCNYAKKYDTKDNKEMYSITLEDYYKWEKKLKNEMENKPYHKVPKNIIDVIKEIIITAPSKLWSISKEYAKRNPYYDGGLVLSEPARDGEIIISEENFCNEFYLLKEYYNASSYQKTEPRMLSNPYTNRIIKKQY